MNDTTPAMNASARLIWSGLTVWSTQEGDRITIGDERAMVKRSMFRSHRLLIVLGAIAVVVAARVALLPLGQGGPGDSGGLIGREAPSLRIDGRPPPVLNGAPVELERLRGRLVWLNFWTTSCVPCRTEMPAMQRLADAYADEGLTVVGIDVGEGADSVRAFVDELGVRYPIVLDFDSTIFNRYSPLFGVPRHYFVGRDGTIVAARIGELRPDEMEPLVVDLLVRRGD